MAALSRLSVDVVSSIICTLCTLGEGLAHDIICGCALMCSNQADNRYDHQAMSDPSLAEETLGLLGEEGVRVGGQALKLG